MCHRWCAAERNLPAAGAVRDGLKRWGIWKRVWGWDGKRKVVVERWVGVPKIGECCDIGLVAIVAKV